MAARYLTPSKIALAFLIGIYCNGYVPSEAELPVLQFLTSHINPEISDMRSSGRVARSKPDSIGSFTVTIQDLKTLLQSFETRFVDPATFLAEDKNVWEILESFLCRFCDFDSLFEEVKHLQNLFVENKENESENNKPSSPTGGKSLLYKGIYRSTKLTQWSLLGIFIRRMMVEFERLRFDDVIRLWRKFEQYRAPLLEHISRSERALTASFLELESMNELSGGKLFQIVDDSLQPEARSRQQMSSVDVEKMLEYQINQMQKNGARMPQEARAQIHSLIGSAAEDSNLINYIRFLEAWYKGDYTLSFEYLHRYYDYAMQHTDRFHYQYALLNMAILQADFGSFDEATAAMKETIATARENKDIHCLNYCLSWLYHFYVKHGDQSSNLVQRVLQGADGGQGIRYLRTAARSHEMHSVETQVVLLEAGEALAKGHRPLEALEKLYEASYLILNHQLNNVKASQLLLHASIYARLGATSLSRSLNSLVIECFGTSASQEEVINARCRNAYFDALEGRYQSALDTLKNLRQQDPHNIRLDQLLAQYIGVIKLKRKLHHHDLSEGERLIAALTSATSTNPDLSFLVCLSEIDLQVRFGNHSQALSIIENAFERYEDRTHSDAYQLMRLLNAKAFIFAQAGRPQKGFSIALRSATAAYKSKNTMVLWESVAALVGVLVGIREWGAAADMAGSAIYRATETEDLCSAALLRKTGVDALVGQAGTTKDEAKRRQLMELALEWTTEASRMYKQLEEYKGRCEMNVKGRAILGYLGDQQAAEMLEKEYHEVYALIGT